MKSTFFQFIKFGIVGILNTLVDFIVLNFLMWLTGIYFGFWIIFLNAISFSCAVIGSYFLNKYWTFRNREKQEKVRQFARFFLISLGGILINSGIVFAGTTFFHPFYGFSAPVWANIVKVVAVAASLVWNFAGYKLFVFKKTNKISNFSPFGRPPAGRQ